MPAGQVREEQQFSAVHHTEDGPVHLEVTKSAEGRWRARFWGRELEGDRKCGTFAQARDYLVRCFAEMYPGHRCTKRCTSPPP